MEMDWDTNARGNITLSPLLAMEARPLHDVGCGVRLVVQLGPEQSPEVLPQTRLLAVQVAMTYEQLQGLIARLQAVEKRLVTPAPMPPDRLT
jgi:hypothetical protein